MVLYWRYRDEESHYLQVGFTVYYIVYRGQQRLWSSTGDTGRRNPTTYRYTVVGFTVYIVYRVQQRL